MIFVDSEQLVEQFVARPSQHVIHFVQDHDEVRGGSSEHFAQTEQHFAERKPTIGMTRVELVQNALSDSHARGGITAVDVSHLQFPFSCKVPLQIPTEGLGQHCFSAAYRAGDDRSGRSFGRSQGGKLRCQFTLNVFSPNQVIGDVIKIQHLWVGDDEPSADAVQIVHHIKGMLMSTVLKDVVWQGPS